MLSPGRSLIPKHLLKRTISRRKVHRDLFSGRIAQNDEVAGILATGATPTDTDSDTLLSENILPINMVPGLNSSVVTGGVAVNALNANIAVGIITNPANPADQGLAFAESLFVDPYGNAALGATGTTFELKPGQSWFAIPYQTTITTVNALTSGHKFSCVQGTNP
jgi:hypothetical protein